MDRWLASGPSSKLKWLICGHDYFDVVHQDKGEGDERKLMKVPEWRTLLLTILNSHMEHVLLFLKGNNSGVTGD